ncbi:MAG: S41 family peptidase [Phycisphaerales bacterium]
MPTRSRTAFIARLTAAGLLVGAAVAVLVPVGVAQQAGAQRSGNASNPYAWFDPLIDVHRLITDRYVDMPDMAALQKGAIDGMIQSLEDPYTEFVPAADLAEFNKELRGEYVGIGALVRFEDGYTTIVTPLDGSPALEAGLRPGDRIVTVDGTDAAGMNADGVVALLTGEPNTRVALTVERDGERIDLEIERRDIVQRTVAGIRRDADNEWDYMLDDEARVGYVRLTQFNAQSPDEMRAALESLRDRGVRSLILDLRFNPGGQLRSAIEIADMFLTSGVIVTTKGRAYTDQSASAGAETVLPETPLIVMLNRGSASASEVLSGALKDNGRAVVLGTRSFGKGVTQGVFNLPSGAGQIKITEQHYYGPSGKMINREPGAADWGIDPTEGFVVPMNDREYAAMLAARRETDIIRRDGDAADPTQPQAGESLNEWIMRAYDDPQLAAAVEAAHLRVDTGEWVPVREEAEGDDASAAESYAQTLRYRDRLLRELERTEDAIAALQANIDVDAADARSVLPDDADLEGGRVQVFDAAGNVVANLRITGEGLERWLTDAPVERDDAEAPAGTR